MGVYDTLEICVDCGMVVANADYSSVDPGDAARIDSALKDWVDRGVRLAVSCPQWFCQDCGDYLDPEETAESHDDEYGHWNILDNDDCECVSFSWRRCDCCGSPLGGSRYHAVALWEGLEE